MRRRRPAPAATELTAFEVRLLVAKGLVDFFPEIIERDPVMAKHRAPKNGYPDIRMVETAGLKRGEWGAETKVAPTLEITRQHMIWMVPRTVASLCRRSCRLSSFW